jgi:chemotaxis protein MotB
MSGGLQIPGAQIVQDRNAIRVRVASDQLFAPGSAQLNPAALAILENFTLLISRQYPRQRIGVEVHTDAPTPSATLVSDPTQMVAAQGKAMIDALTQRGLPLQQLMLTTVGAAQPIADNQTPAGRAQNRRIELVIYQN